MQQAKEAAKDVAVKKEASLPTNFNLEEMAGQGQEFVTARDTKLPILKILYANSPVLDESDGKYIESAKQGDIYNETSGNLYKGKDGLIVVPCLYINTFNEWKDRGDSPGRPVAVHTDPSIMSQTNRGDDGKDRLENGNYVEDTGNHFVYVLNFLQSNTKIYTYHIQVLYMEIFHIQTMLFSQLISHYDIQKINQNQ